MRPRRLLAITGTAIVVSTSVPVVSASTWSGAAARATGAYYYQTHVRVTDAAQVSLATDAP